MADKVNNKKPRLLALCGPTASGKTALSIALAQRLGGEIICADSMQIYQKLTVGTAKVTKEEMQGIPHHLVDFVPPQQQFSVADYVAAAQECVSDITRRGKLPILVGGTGLYVQSLLEGLRFNPEKTDTALRARLQERFEKEGIDPLYKELCALDPAHGNALHPNNHGRVLRGLELFLQTGRSMAQRTAASRPAQRPYQDVLLVLNFASREQLYARIHARVQSMLGQGLLEEAKLVYTNRDIYYTAAQAIGYKEFFSYFEGQAALEACVATLEQASRNYAKRQLTWFRRMEGAQWLEATAENLPDVAARLWNSKLQEGGNAN